MTKAQFNAELDKNLKVLKDKIPPEKKGEVTKMLKRRIVDEFIARTLLKDEADQLKIVATESEISSAMDELKRNLPPGLSMEDMLKRNGITQSQLKEELSLGIRVKKLLAREPKVNVKPSEKEIKEFYDKNRDKFKSPEMVHVRHILVAKQKDDTDATRAQKIEKIERIRKQLLAGGDFAQLAKENSDCPSKERGGDLGTFVKGQMKKFEDAAFSQKRGEIGPVVETEFGWHIIQVMEHTPEQVQPLTDEIKSRIADYLEERNKYAALNNLMNRLKSNAKIAVADGI